MAHPEERECPNCEGFGYFEDGTEEGELCATCDGDGVVDALDGLPGHPDDR